MSDQFNPENPEANIEQELARVAKLPLGHEYLEDYNGNPGCYRCGQPRAAHEPPATMADHPFKSPWPRLDAISSDLSQYAADPCVECGGLRSAHPPAPPAPELEPKCCCLEFWASHPPDCPRVLAGLEKSPEPAPSPKDRLGEMAALMLGGTCPHTPDHPKNARDCWRCLRSELERVVRETAQAAASHCGSAGCPDGQCEAGLRRWGLSQRREADRER